MTGETNRPGPPPRKPPAPLPILPVVEPEPDESELGDGEEPRAVLITGAAGKLGRLLRAAWEDDYLVIPLDRRTPEDDPDVIPADLSTWDEDWLAHVDEPWRPPAE